MALLNVRNLSVAIQSGKELLPIIYDISFQLKASSTLGIVGESGCGKSITALSIMGLTEGTPIFVTGGSIRFDGEELVGMQARNRRKLMGNRMAMIFQEPMTSLNPVYRVKDQIVESILQHQSLSRAEAHEKAVELLADVRIPNPSIRQYDYPHQMSGGLRQRVMIAMAISCAPDLLIADEATTALDVTVQSQILDLLLELQEKNGMALMMISHDLAVVANTCDHVAIMYCGRIIETSRAESLFCQPQHPYTVGLIQSIPDPDRNILKLNPIDGAVPPPGQMPEGCSFHPRCNRKSDLCLKAFSSSQLLRSVLCHHPYETSNSANHA